MIILGELMPGTRLSEHKVAALGSQMRHKWKVLAARNQTFRYAPILLKKSDQAQ